MKHKQTETISPAIAKSSVGLINTFQTHGNFFGRLPGCQSKAQMTYDLLLSCEMQWRALAVTGGTSSLVKVAALPACGPEVNLGQLKVGWKNQVAQFLKYEK
jgi:hypothetical protein